MVNNVKASFRYSSFVVLVLTALTCSGQTILFRVITTDGKPLENRKVAISLNGFKNNGEPIGGGQARETDSNGEARLALPSPSAEHFVYHIELGSPYWYCGCTGIPKTQTVLQVGIVDSAARKDSQSDFKPEPGEVLVVARKFSFVEKLLYPLLKD